jgi:hypothetical protein
MPRSVNLNPGLQKTVADNMPFFGKSTNKDYGGQAGDIDMKGVALFSKPKDQKYLSPPKIKLEILWESICHCSQRPLPGIIISLSWLVKITRTQSYYRRN